MPRYVANGKTTYQPLYKGNVQGGRGGGEEKAEPLGGRRPTTAKENLRRRTDLSMDREPWCTCTKKLMKIRFTGRCLRCQDVRTFKACIESLFGRHQRGVLLVFFYQIAMLRRLRQEPRATVPTIPQLGASVPNVSRVRESARERRKTERERKTERKQQQRRGNLSRSVCFEQILGGGGRGGRGGGGGG